MTTFKTFSLMPPAGICRLGPIQNVPEWALMASGVPQGDSFPANAGFRMDPGFPKDLGLADALNNTNRFLILSQKLVDFLASLDALVNNEILEVGIINHKGRRESAKHFIVHQIHRPQCVDSANTVGTKSNVDPSQYMFLKKLVLLPDRLDPKVAVFRAAEYAAEPLFRVDIADRILAGGYTGGIEFFGLDAFDRQDRRRVRMGA